MNVRQSSSIKNIFYDKMELKFFYFDVTIWSFSVDVLELTWMIVNPFQSNVPFSVPLKTSEKQMFPDVIKADEKGKLTWYGLISMHYPMEYVFPILKDP